MHLQVGGGDAEPGGYSRISRGTPEALSCLCVCRASFLMTFVKKIRDTKGTFHAKMGSTKDRNGMDPTEEEDIKKR